MLTNPLSSLFLESYWGLGTPHERPFLRATKLIPQGEPYKRLSVFCQASLQGILIRITKSVLLNLTISRLLLPASPFRWFFHDLERSKGLSASFRIARSWKLYVNRIGVGHLCPALLRLKCVHPPSRVAWFKCSHS